MAQGYQTLRYIARNVHGALKGNLRCSCRPGFHTLVLFYFAVSYGANWPPMLYCGFVASVSVLSAFVGVAAGTKLQPVPSGWDNPTKLSMNIYVPEKLAEKPPVILVVGLFHIRR